MIHALLVGSQIDPSGPSRLEPAPVGAGGHIEDRFSELYDLTPECSNKKAQKMAETLDVSCGTSVYFLHEENWEIETLVS